MGSPTPQASLDLSKYLPPDLYQYFSTTGLADEKTRQLIKDLNNTDYIIHPILLALAPDDGAVWLRDARAGASRLLADLIALRGLWRRIETCGVHGNILKLRCANPSGSTHIRRCRLCKQYLPTTAFRHYIGVRNAHRAGAPRIQYAARCDDCKGKRSIPAYPRPKLPPRDDTYYASHREEMLAQHKIYYAANRELIAERRRKYYAKNRDWIKARMREYNAKRKAMKENCPGGEPGQLAQSGQESLF